MNVCGVCGGEEEECCCHHYEWGECVNPRTREKWAPHKAWFLKGHVGDPDYYASL